MIKLKKFRKIPVLVDDINDVVEIKKEDLLRISFLGIDYLQRTIRVVYHKGYLNEDGSFAITNNKPIILVLDDSDGSFTELTTPTDPKDWIGQVQIKRLENFITRRKKLPEAIEVDSNEEIVSQHLPNQKSVDTIK